MFSPISHDGDTRITREIMSGNSLINAALNAGNLKNDAALARLIDVAPPVISKIRSGRLPVGPSMILKLHEHPDLKMSLGDIRKLAAQP
jgi:plasmid maintenance system antidote protein VapI